MGKGPRGQHKDGDPGSLGRLQPRNDNKCTGFLVRVAYRITRSNFTPISHPFHSKFSRLIARRRGPLHTFHRFNGVHIRDGTCARARPSPIDGTLSRVCLPVQEPREIRETRKITAPSCDYFFTPAVNRCEMGVKSSSVIVKTVTITGTGGTHHARLKPTMADGSVTGAASWGGRAW